MLKPFWNKKKNIDDRLTPAVTAADAGKALVVDENGKIIASEVGGDSLYLHSISFLGGAGISFLSGPYCQFVSTKSSPYTLEEFCSLLSRINTGSDDQLHTLRMVGAITITASNVPYILVNPAPDARNTTTRIYVMGTGFNAGDGTATPTTHMFITANTGTAYFNAISDTVKPYPYD